MAYRCEHCGFTLADDEIIMMKEPHGEEWACCPRCKSSDLEELHQCKRCGSWECEDDLTDGLCDYCLKDMVTADRFKRFGTEDTEPDEVSILEEYVWEWYLGLEPLHRSHPILKEMLEREFILDASAVVEWPRIAEFVMENYKDEWAEFCRREVDADAREGVA